MARNFYLSFEKIDDRAASASKHDDSNVIRLPAATVTPAANRSTWAAFGRSPFLAADAKPAFPPFYHLKRATIDVVCVVFGLFFITAVIAAIPLAMLILWMSILGG